MRDALINVLVTYLHNSSVHIEPEEFGEVRCKRTDDDDNCGTWQFKGLAGTFKIMNVVTA